MGAKITIEQEGCETVVLEFDSIHQRTISRNVFRFFENAYSPAAELSSDGAYNITIIGVVKKDKDRFDKLCSRYPCVERVGR